MTPRRSAAVDPVLQTGTEGLRASGNLSSGASSSPQPRLRAAMDVIERMRSPRARFPEAPGGSDVVTASVVDEWADELEEALMGDKSMNEIPRRIRFDQLIPAERAIYDAVQAVEAVGADVRLTDAVILLQAARDSVADYVDGISTRRLVAAPDPLGEAKNEERFCAKTDEGVSATPPVPRRNEG